MFQKLDADYPNGDRFPLDTNFKSQVPHFPSKTIEETWQCHNENGLSGGEEASGHEDRVNGQPVGEADLQGRAPGAR